MRSHRWWIQNCSVWRSVSKNMAHDDLPMLYRHRVAALHWKESAPALPLHHEVYSTHAIDPATHIATPRDRGACTHNTWARMPDILDWIEANRNALQQVGALRWQETHGFLYYGTVFWTWLTRRQNRDPSSSSQAVPDEKIGSVSASASNVSASEQTTSGATSKSCNEAPLHGAARLQVVATQERLEKKSNETATTPSEAGSSNMMEQYQESRELCNILKWKRVTWDADADYEGFARRILEVHAHGYFSTIPAMSHLCVHVVADRELKRPTRWEPVSPSQDYRSIQSGSLTAWALHEGVPFLITADPGKESEPREPRGDDVETPQHSSPFRVDWSRGEICLLDTASPSDVYTFLTHYAQPLQRVQLEYAEEQERMAELVESVRFRCSLVALHFNDTTQQALRDDGPEFVARCRGAPGGYVTTDQVLEFCSSMLRTAWLFRRFLRGHVVRILPPRHPYEIDLERRVIGIPCDFGRYHYRREHRRYLRHESIANTYRNYWFVWLLVVCAMIGDLDIF